MTDLKNLIIRLKNDHILEKKDFIRLLEGLPGDSEAAELLGEEARRTARNRFGRKIYIRGLIEFTNYCRNDCYYCGIRCGNRHADRYRLSSAEILEMCIRDRYRPFLMKKQKRSGSVMIKLQSRILSGSGIWTCGKI